MARCRLARTAHRAIDLLPDCECTHPSSELQGPRDEKRRSVMTRSIAVLVALASVLGASQVYAQESAAGPAPVVVTIIPGGATFFTEGKDTKGPSFSNYDLGGAVTVNFNRFVGVEGEVSGALGIAQDLAFSSGTSNLKTPNLLNYSGNLVVSAPNKSSVVPYVTGGVGGLSIFEKQTLGIIGTQTFFTSNVG